MKKIHSQFLVCLGSAVLAATAPAAEVSDFALEDHNLSSPRSGQAVSPRDYRHQVTAWYFGAAT